jgi:hypothetical protein
MENEDAPFVVGKPVHLCPGSVGGAEWNGAAYDPQLNLVFIGEVEWCTTVTLMPTEKIATVAPGQPWPGEASINPFYRGMRSIDQPQLFHHAERKQCARSQGRYVEPPITAAGPAGMQVNADGCTRAFAYLYPVQSMDVRHKALWRTTDGREHEPC